jgi:hypothetical protein
MFLSVAQYNGITSVILALVVGAMFGEAVTIVAMAVITINTVYFLANQYVEKRTRQV